MQNRTFLMSAIILIVTSITVILSSLTETISVFAGVNPFGILAATFAAVVGFAWLFKNR